MYPHTSSLLPVLTGLMLVFTSCSSQDDPTPEPRPVRISLTASAGQGTRTVLANDGSSVHFQPDDALSVIGFTFTNNKFTTHLSTVSSSATFTGEVNLRDLSIPKTLFAVYPYESNPKYSYSSKTHYITATLPTKQMAVEGSFDPKANISVGAFVGNSSQTHYEVTLYNACALAKLTIDASLECDKVVLSSVAETTEKAPLPLSGRRPFEPHMPSYDTATSESDTDQEISDDSDLATPPSPSVTLVAPEGKTLAGTYYIVLWPQNTMVSIVLTNKDGATIKTRRSKSSVEFVRSKITDLGKFEKTLAN